MNKNCCFKTGKVPTNELQIYTWKDASLKELTSLVREVNAESRRKGTFFDFALIYPSPSSRGNFQRQTNQFMDYISKEIGTTVFDEKRDYTFWACSHRKKRGSAPDGERLGQ